MGRDPRDAQGDDRSTKRRADAGRPTVASTRGGSTEPSKPCAAEVVIDVPMARELSSASSPSDPVMAPLTPTASVTQPSGARRMYGTAADVVRTPLAPTPADVAPVDRAAAEQEELEVSIRLMEDSAADWEEEIEHLYPRRTA